MSNVMTNRFEDFLLEKNDCIDNAAYDLVCALASHGACCDDESPEWDMAYIGEIVDAAVEILSKQSIRCCHPYYSGDDRTPCFMDSDCKLKDCPLREV